MGSILAYFWKQTTGYRLNFDLDLVKGTNALEAAPKKEIERSTAGEKFATGLPRVNETSVVIPLEE